MEDMRDAGPGCKISVRGGIVTVIIAIMVILLDGDPREILGLLETQQTSTEQVTDYQPSAHEQELTEFVRVVLTDTEDVWHKLFEGSELTYREPKLVLFNSAVESACGHAQSAIGPFYYPATKKFTST